MLLYDYNNIVEKKTFRHKRKKERHCFPTLENSAFADMYYYSKASGYVNHDS